MLKGGADSPAIMAILDALASAFATVGQPFQADFNSSASLKRISKKLSARCRSAGRNLHLAGGTQAGKLMSIFRKRIRFVVTPGVEPL
jgi:hypothetical protein